MKITRTAEVFTDGILTLPIIITSCIPYMKQTDINIVNIARPFEIDELFFSTTNTKGIITACNEVFIRVSGFAPEELLSKPHNVIRHPHMPRCVFKLLWDYLLASKSIGAYVKNLAATGEYYWVFAAVVPVKEGFLSIRIKPTSSIFSVVEGLYQELLEIESQHGNNWKAGMSHAEEVLLKKLASLGYDSYDNFMSDALRVELESRSDRINSPGSKLQTTEISELGPNAKTASAWRAALRPTLSGLGQLVELRNKLHSEQDFLQTFQSQLTLVALNAGVNASHLAEAGKSLGVISSEISKLSKLISGQSGALSKALERLNTALNNTSFNICMTSLQCELVTYFSSEQKNLKLSVEEERRRFGKPVADLGDLLIDTCRGSLSRVVGGLLDLDQALSSFQEVASNLTRILLTIQFSYVTGKTLAAGVQNGHKFAVLLQDLITVADSARNTLVELMTAVSNVKDAARTWEIRI